MNGNPAYQLRCISHLPLTKLAPMVGVSRQAYHKWLKGKAITPEHLSTIKQLLQNYPKEMPPITFEYTAVSATFDCSKCGEQLVLKRRSLASASGLFCATCNEHYWINWNVCILRNGEELYEPL